MSECKHPVEGREPIIIVAGGNSSGGTYFGWRCTVCGNANARNPIAELAARVAALEARLDPKTPEQIAAVLFGRTPQSNGEG